MAEKTFDFAQIPHIGEIACNGEFKAAKPRNTATFEEKFGEKNKVVDSLETAIRLSGLKDGDTISFHHHFRNGDHIINQVVAKLAEMGFKNLTLASSSLAAVHAPLIEYIEAGVITHIETSALLPP